MLVKYSDDDLLPSFGIYTPTVLCQIENVDGLQFSNTMRNPASYRTPVFNFLRFIAQTAIEPLTPELKFFFTNFKFDILFVLTGASSFTARVWATKTQTLGQPATLAKPFFWVTANSLTGRIFFLIHMNSNFNRKCWIIDAIKSCWRGRDQANTWRA